MEKQGGVDDMYSSAKTFGMKWANHAIMVHSNRNKEEKIRDALGTAEIVSDGSKKIKYLKHTKFMHNLSNSQLVEQIRTFPGCMAFNDDAIDCYAMGLMELEKKNKNLSYWRF